MSAVPEFVFAHLADAHVGAWSRDPAVRRALRESVLRALSEVRKRNCEFLLISGDLFHTPVPEPAEVAPVAAALREIVAGGRRVYVIYGSHDYVAHRTSWLDVLAETGLFLRAAPEAVRAEGERWTLPFLTDAPTGAKIAGISGRSHGLDRSYFRAIDSEAFRRSDGFKIFQFHAAVHDYLPEMLRAHIQGIDRDDLPGGCDYYAGGHIHYSYVGEGPEGGVLVNPGAVFGTSLTDLENGAAGRTHQGIVIVTVRNGVAEPEFVDTAPRGDLKVFDVDVAGRTAEEARRTVEEALTAHAAPGAMLFPRVRGTLRDGTLGALGMHRNSDATRSLGVETIHWDVRDASGARPEAGEEVGSITGLEGATITALAQETDAALAELLGPEGAGRVRALLAELGTARGEGEAQRDYLNARIDGALRILGVTTTARSPSEAPNAN